jgi:WD40 repeat protein
LSSRIAHARALLQKRLTRRGVMLSAALTAGVMWNQPASAALIDATQKAALPVAAGQTVSAAATPAVAALVDGAARVVGVKAKLAVLVLLAGIIGGTLGLASSEQPAAITQQSNNEAKPSAALPIADVRKAKADLYGDPLPPGAIARLGTVRLRHPYPRIAFAPDGKSLISLGPDYTVRRWDKETGKYLDGRLLETRAENWEDVELSPDGKFAVLLTANGLGVFDVTTGKKLGNVVPPQEQVTRLAVGPGGKALAACTQQRSKHVLRLWDITSGAERVLLELDHFVERLTFSTDGRFLGVIGLDNTLRVWDVNSGKLLHGFKADMGGIAFSADGKLVAAGINRTTVKVWDVTSGTEHAQLQAKEPLYATYLTFSPDGKRLAAGGPQGVCIWDVTTRKELCRLADQHIGWLAFAPDGKTLAASGGSTIRLWDVDSVKRLLFPGMHDFQIASIAASPDGKRLATSGYSEGQLCVWDAASGKLLHSHVQPRGGLTTCFSADGRLVASGGGTALTLWEADTGKEWKRFPVRLAGTEEASVSVEHLALFADGKRLAAIGRSMDGGNAVLLVWEIATGKLVTQRPISADSWSHFSNYGEFVTERTVKGLSIQETVTGREFMVIPGISNHVLAFSPDGKLLAARTEIDPARPLAAGVAVGPNDPDAVVVVELASGKTIYRLESGTRPALAFSSDSRLLAISDIHSVRVQEIATGKEVLRRKIHAAEPGLPAQADFTALAFFPKNRVLATGLLDGTTLLWDLAPKPAKPNDLDAQTLDGLWSDLAGDDAGKAYRAIWRMESSAGQTVGCLKDRLSPAAFDAKRVKALIAELDSEEFLVRQKAGKELEKYGPEATPRFREVLSGEPSLEVRKRLEALLARPLLPVPSGDALRQVRAVTILEHIANAEVRDLLKKMTAGAPEARLTREAKAALQRLERSNRSLPEK